MQRASTLLAALLPGVICASMALAQSDPPVPKEASQAAEDMVARFVDSWNHADGAAYGENYWPEAELSIRQG